MRDGRLQPPMSEAEVRELLERLERMRRQLHEARHELLKAVAPQARTNGDAA